MANITLAKIEIAVQNEIRNTVNSPFDQTRRVEAYNRVIDILQDKANWNRTRQVAPFDFLDREVDYSLSNDLGVSDFKQYEDLRVIEDNTTQQRKEFEEVEPVDFSIYERQNNFNNFINFEERDASIIMRVLANMGRGKTVVDSMDDLTTGRTWASDTTDSDATTLVQDTIRAKSGNSLRFNIDVSQSVNNLATISTTTVLSDPIDGSLLENIGYFRFWLGLHSFTAANLARITSVELRWGNSSSVYWSRTVTTPSTGGSFVKGFNRMSFRWEDASETGSVDNSELDFFRIAINYTSALTDSNNVRIDEIVLIEPSELELVYFSNNMVLNGSTNQVHFTTSTVDTSEELLLPESALNMFVKLAAKELFPQKERDSKDYLRVEKEAKEQLARAIQQYGNAITRASAEFDIDGESSGRADTSSSHW